MKKIVFVREKFIIVGCYKMERIVPQKISIQIGAEMASPQSDRSAALYKQVDGAIDTVLNNHRPHLIENLSLLLATQVARLHCLKKISVLVRKFKPRANLEYSFVHTSLP